MPRRPGRSASCLCRSCSLLLALLAACQPTPATEDGGAPTPGTMDGGALPAGEDAGLGIDGDAGLADAGPWADAGVDAGPANDGGSGPGDAGLADADAGALDGSWAPVAWRLADPADVAKPDYVKAMASLPGGEVAVALIQSDTIVVDGTGATLAGAGSDTGVIVYDPHTGRAGARFSFGGGAPRVVPHGLVADPSGDLVVVGYAAGSGASTVDFGAGPVPFAAAEAPFVARLSPTGQLRWAHLLTGSGGMSPAGCPGTNCDRAWDVALSTTGQVAVVGGFSGTLQLPGGPLTAAGGSDVFVLVLSAQGAQEAAWSIGGPGNEAGFQGTPASPGGLGEMAVAAVAGGWVVQGTFQAGAEFKGTGATSSLLSPANGVRDLFVARYSALGTLLAPAWVAGAAADVVGGFAAPGAMRADAAGALYFSMRANVGGQAWPGCAAVGGTGEALVTVSLSAALGCRWTRRFDFTGGGVHRTVPDGAGSVYVAGWFTGSHAFPNQRLVSRSTRSDVFLARLGAASGAPTWGSGLLATTAVAAAHIPAGLAIDGLGHPWVGGQLFAAMEVAQPGQTSVVLRPVWSGAVAATSNDGFVARYDAATGGLR